MTEMPRRGDDGVADEGPRLPWWWRGSLIGLGLAMALFRLLPTEADPDLWGHLRFGLDLLDTGRVVRPDTYSYLTSSLTGGQPWINHEWLAEALLAIAWRAAGSPGIIAMKVALALGVALVVCRHLTRRGVSLLASLLMTAYGMAVMLPAWRSLRPQAFTYLACALLLVLIHRASRGRRAGMWIAPPLLAVWANLHGGFVAGLGLVALWSMADAVAGWRRGGRAEPGVGERPDGHDERRARRWQPWLVALASLAATLITPYGWTLWTFLARTLGPRPDIAEWHAVPLGTIQGAAYLAFVFLGAFGLIGTRRPRHAIDVLLFLGGAVLPLVAQRHLPLCVLITLTFCGEHMASAASALVTRLTRRGCAPGATRSQATQRFRPLVAGALLLEAAIVIWMTVTAPDTGAIIYKADDYPVVATARLAESGVSANVAVFFDWGEYVLWHAGPRIKVSVDGRRETVYSEAVYEENMAFTDGVDGVDGSDGVAAAPVSPVPWDRLLTQRPTDLALVSVVTPAYRRLSADPGWELILRDGPAALFGRLGSVTTLQVARSHAHAIAARALPGDTTLIFP